MPANYDKIAKVYDFISRLVYGNALVNAQVWLLKYVPANSRILIVGGGTGWILEKFAAIHSNGLIIDYVESSAKMIALSQKRKYQENEVNFINVAIENYTTTNKYDVILTPFLFDNFTADKIQILFTQLNALLKPTGTWLYADFMYDKQKSPLWQKVLLKTMYFFFKLTSDIETQELVSMDVYFKTAGYNKMERETWFFNFIQSVAFQKS